MNLFLWNPCAIRKNMQDAKATGTVSLRLAGERDSAHGPAVEVLLNTKCCWRRRGPRTTDTSTSRLASSTYDTSTKLRKQVGQSNASNTWW